MPFDPETFAPRRILLIQLRAMGDVVLTTPAIRVLKQTYPQAEIDFITNPPTAALLTGNPYLRRAVAFPCARQDVLGTIRYAFGLRREGYDLAIDFLGTAGAALMTWACGAKVRIGYNLRVRKLAYTHYDQEYRGDIYNPVTKFSLLKPLGIRRTESRTELVVQESARAWVREYFAGQGWDGRSVVAVAPYAMAPARRWLPERFAQAADWLAEQGHAVVFTWGPGERDYVEGVIARQRIPASITPPTTLPQLAALLERCRLLVCNCSGTKHVAVAVGTPTLTIFGPSNPDVWHPMDDPRHAYLRAEGLDCLKCGRDECADLKCMEGVSVAQVTRAIEGMLGRGRESLLG